MTKNNFRILKKTHAYLQTILKAPVKIQKDRPKTVGGVKGTRYLLKFGTTHHAPRKAQNSVPPLFFEKPVCVLPKSCTGHNFVIH